MIFKALVKRRRVQSDPETLAARVQKDPLRSSAMRGGRAIFAALVATFIAAGCRGLLGIEERDLLAEGGTTEAGDEAAPEEAGLPSSSYCDTLSPKPLFCADFDDGVLARGFENEDKTPDPGEFGGGLIARDTVTWKSRGASAKLSLPSLLTGTSGASAFLLKPFTTIPSALRVDFDVRVATEYMPPKTAGNVILATLHFVPTCSIELVRDSVGTALAVYVGKSGTRTSVVTVSQPFPVGVWKRVTMFVHADADAGSGSGIAEVSIENIPAASAPIPTTFPTPATQLNVSVGAVYGHGPTGPFEANIDNVRIYAID